MAVGCGSRGGSPRRSSNPLEKCCAWVGLGGTNAFDLKHFNPISGRSTLCYWEVWIAPGLPSAAEERYMEDGEEELLDLEGEEEEMHEPALSLTVVETEQVFDSKVEIERTKAET